MEGVKPCQFRGMLVTYITRNFHGHIHLFRLIFFSRTHCRIPLFSENVMRLEYIDGPHEYNISTGNDYCNYLTLFKAKPFAVQNVLFSC